MTTSITGRNDNPRAGFTLLELVLVMVIICTVLAMASPSLRGFFASRQTADAAAQMVALTRYARTQAVAEGRAYRLNIEIDSGRYWLTAQSAGAFVNLTNEFGRVFHLPDGTTAQWQSSPEATDHGWIGFYADGRADAAQLMLTGRRGDTAQVVCNAPAEPYRVVLGAEEENK